jgi:hypothetical protein
MTWVTVSTSSSARNSPAIDTAVAETFLITTAKNSGVLPLKFCGVSVAVIVTPLVLVKEAIFISPMLRA